MIAFTLKESADRIALLAQEVPSSSLRDRLVRLSQQLLRDAGVVDRDES